MKKLSGQLVGTAVLFVCLFCANLVFAQDIVELSHGMKFGGIGVENDGNITIDLIITNAVSSPDVGHILLFKGNNVVARFSTGPLANGAQERVTGTAYNLENGMYECKVWSWRTQELRYHSICIVTTTGIVQISGAN